MQHKTQSDVIHLIAYIFIGTGALTFIVSFLGYCGAMFESRCLLCVVSTIVYVIIYHDSTHVGRKKYLYFIFKNYHTWLMVLFLFLVWYSDPGDCNPAKCRCWLSIWIRQCKSNIFSKKIFCYNFYFEQSWFLFEWFSLSDSSGTEKSPAIHNGQLQAGQGECRNRHRHLEWNHDQGIRPEVNKINVEAKRWKIIFFHAKLSRSVLFVVLKWTFFSLFQFHCCGVDNYEDFKKYSNFTQRIPEACCKRDDNDIIVPGCTQSPNESNSYYNVVRNFFN